MANPPRNPPSSGGYVNLNREVDNSDPPNLQGTKGPVPWPRTKKTFYIWWILQDILPLLLSVGGLIGGIIEGFSSDKKSDRGPDDLPLALVWVLAILQPLAHLTLLYYLSVKIRALYARVSVAHRQAGQQSGLVGSSGDSRWLAGFGRHFDSALEREEYFMESRKGAGILLGMSTLWIAAVGMATVAMLTFVVFLGAGGLIGFVVLIVGGLSLLGHLVFVWGRSVKVLVLGACAGRGRGGRRGREREGRRRGGDVEEGEEEEDGERLLPLGVDAQGGT